LFSRVRDCYRGGGIIVVGIEIYGGHHRHFSE